MKKILFTLILFVTANAYSQKIKALADLKGPDPNTLVVIDNIHAGKWIDVKGDLEKMTASMFRRFNVLKGDAATKKYGDKGKAGAIEIELNNAQIIEEKVIPSPNYTSDSIFSKVDIEAGFSGGDNAWRNYLVRTLDAEIPNTHYVPPGTYTVIVQFVVDKTGGISDIKALTKHGYGMEEEVIRVITKGPKWAPAIQNGRTVKAYRKQPVTFVMSGEFELSTYKLKAGEETTIELLGVSAPVVNIFASISPGMIRLIGDKKYVVKVDKPGFALFSVSVADKKGKINEIGKIALKVE
jgi:hypothetical protein